MKSTKFPEIKLYVSFISCLIRKFLLCTLEMMMFDSNDTGYLEKSFSDDIILMGSNRNKKGDNLKYGYQYKAKGSHSPVNYSDPLLVTQNPTRYSHLLWLYYHRYFIKYLILQKNLANKSKSDFKQWNDTMTCYITLLFGLSNIRPFNLYDAIFGSSSYRIH